MERMPEHIFEDRYTLLERAIHALPEEQSTETAQSLYEDAGGDTNHPVWVKLQSAVGELTDAVNEMVGVMEDLQHDIASRLTPEDGLEYGREYERQEAQSARERYTSRERYT